VRGTDEFTRLLTVTDGVFAIAMTLLVVGIAIPALADSNDVGELADALHDRVPDFVSFFIGFAVIGRYWGAHNEFFARLDRVDRPLIAINFVYLAFIAFLPFPTGLVGAYFQNPLSVALYAVMVAIISGLAGVLFAYAHRHELMRMRLPQPIFRWGVIQSISPVFFFFFLSIPIAFASTVLAVIVWFAGVPFQVIANRWKPPGADRFFAP
jgi:uncharacterized membrane protein